MQNIAAVGEVERGGDLTDDADDLVEVERPGTEKVVDMAKRLGVRSPLEPVVSLPLGVFDITPIDMASAYATFANDGMRNEPYYVERIEDRNGKVLYQHQLNPVRVIDSQTARLMNQTLAANVTGGTGKNARIDSGLRTTGAG